MGQCRAAGLAAVLLGARGCRRRVRPAGAAGVQGRLQLCPSGFFLTSCPSLSVMTFLLVFFSAVAVSRALVQQEPSAETSESTGINITCSHPNVQNSKDIAAIGVGRPPLQCPVARPAPARERGGVLLRVGSTGRGAGAAAEHEPLWAGRGHSAVRLCRGRCLQGRQTPS